MKSNKYYNHTNGSSIDTEVDGCDFENWAVMHRTAEFARHPDGFLIFIPPGKIDDSDDELATAYGFLCDDYFAEIMSGIIFFSL